MTLPTAPTGRRSPRRVELGHSDLTVSLGAVIRDRRQRLRLTQRALGARIGIHRQQVGLVERGRANLTLRMLETFADGLQFKPSDLLAAAEGHADQLMRSSEDQYMLPTVARRLDR